MVDLIADCMHVVGQPHLHRRAPATTTEHRIFNSFVASIHAAVSAETGSARDPRYQAA
jgi:hypothetical protein